MLLILIGALLVLTGIVVLAGPPIWLARASRGRPPPTPARATLEPPKPGAGFNLKENWPGLVLMASGAVILLASAFP
jgi:hypothetical protein